MIVGNRHHLSFCSPKNLLAGDLKLVFWGSAKQGGKFISQLVTYHLLTAPRAMNQGIRSRIHMPLWKPARPVGCAKALFVLETSFYGVWPASSCTWGECFPVEHSNYQVSLMLWVMEICRRSDIAFFVESVYDDKWYAYTKDIDARFVRVWVPIEDQMRLSQFLQQASLSLATAKSTEPTETRKRKASQALSDDDETDAVSHKVIKSKHDLIKAVMHNFMGLRSKSISDIDLDVPADDDVFSPISPMCVWSAQTMFEDSLYQKRWRRERIAPWQTDLENYISAEGEFRPPPHAAQYPGILRQIDPGAPWMENDAKKGMDAILCMAMPHVLPSRLEVEEKLYENARASGNNVGPFESLSNSEFWSLFVPAPDDAGSASADLIDPVNFSPIEYRPVCYNQEYNNDTPIMEALYPTVLLSKNQMLGAQSMIGELVLDVPDDTTFDDHVGAMREEVEIVKERIVHATEVQLQGPCYGVPDSFWKVYRELMDKLMPAMKRSKAVGGAAWELFSMDFALSERDSFVTTEALMTTHKVEMAASADGLDLTQPQIMVWSVLFDGVMQLLGLYWNRIQLCVSTTGHTQLGKSEAGVAAQASVAESLGTTCDGQSNKSVYLTGDIALRIIDERKEQANDRSPETTLLQTMLQKAWITYEQYFLGVPSKRRPFENKDVLKKWIADKRGVFLFCGNFKAAHAVQTRSINVDWAGDTEGGNARQLGERVNASRSERPETLLCLKLWSALSVIPHALDANGGVVGGVEESMVNVFFALYDHIMVRSHGKKIIKPRNMRHIATVARGVMIESLLTKVYRYSDAPWDVTPKDCLTAMRNGGYVISMEHILTAYLTILKTEDNRKTRAQILGGIKSLIDFELDNHPRLTANKQYYILRADKKNVYELLQEVIPNIGEGLIRTYAERLLQEKDRVTGERVMQETREGKLQILCSVLDVAGVVSGAEIALQSLLRTIRDEELATEPGELPDPKNMYVSFDEQSMLLPNHCVLQFTEGRDGIYADRFSGLKDTYVQGIYFWERKRILKNYRSRLSAAGPDDLPECLALVDAPQPGFVPCEIDGLFDYRRRGGGLAYKMPFQRPCTLEVKFEHLDEMYEQSKIYENDSVEAPTRELIDVCMHVSGEAKPGQKVFFGLANHCDEHTLPARLHIVKAPPRFTYTILNPDRKSKMSSMRHKGAEPLLGYDTHAVLDGDSNLYKNLVDAFKVRNLEFS